MVVQTAASCGNIDPVWMNCSKDTKKEFHLQTGCLRGPCLAAVGMLRQCMGVKARSSVRFVSVAIACFISRVGAKIVFVDSFI